MGNATRNWIVRQLTLGEFSSRRAVVRRAIWMATKIAMLAYGLNLCAHFVLVAFDLLPYDLFPALVIATVLTPPVSFVVAVIAYAVVGFAIYDLGVSRSELERISRIDMLSGLLNRRAFHKAFDDSRGDASLVLFDIDRFKAVNDTFGHSAGDDVIAAVAEVIRETFADGEVCARIGGEEFAVLWSRTAPQFTERADIVRQCALVAAGENPCASISGGIADNRRRASTDLLRGRVRSMSPRRADAIESCAIGTSTRCRTGPSPCRRSSIRRVPSVLPAERPRAINPNFVVCFQSLVLTSSRAGRANKSVVRCGRLTKVNTSLTLLLSNLSKGQGLS
jgi:GGDEF domain-containing protein